MQPLDRIGRARAAPLARRQSCEGEQPIAGFLQAVGDGAVLKPPLADEGLAADFNLLARGGVDHVGVVGGDLLVQALGGVREEIAMLVNRAALDRHAVRDDGDGLVEPRAPSTMRNSGRRKPRSTRSSRTVRQASVLSPPEGALRASGLADDYGRPVKGANRHQFRRHAGRQHRVRNLDRALIL